MGMLLRHTRAKMAKKVEEKAKPVVKRRPAKKPVEKTEE